mgnify:FL=1
MESNLLAPIVLFVYNRPWHTRETLNALMQNELASESKLYIYCDGPKPDCNNENLNRIIDVRKIIREEHWCREVVIIESDRNKGLASSIINGVTEIIFQFKKVIVLEDDLVTSKFFLRFMNEALEFYKDDKRIFSIGGTNYLFPIPEKYPHDVYIVHRVQSWGWGTWLDRWGKADWGNQDYSNLLNNRFEIKQFNRGGNDLIKILKLQLEGKIDSWAILWDYCHYLNNAYCLHPVKSFTRNIGFDGTGIHCSDKGGDIQSGIPYGNQNYDLRFVKDILPNKHIEKNFKAFFKEKKISHISILKSILNSLMLYKHSYKTNH